MADIHIETGTDGVTLDYPAAIEGTLLPYVQAEGVALGDTVTTLEEPEGVPAIRSTEVHHGVDRLMLAIDKWFEEKGITPGKTSDGEGNLHWEYGLT